MFLSFITDLSTMSIEIVRNAPKMEKDIVMTFPVRLMSFIRHISELSTGISTNVVLMEI